MIYVVGIGPGSAGDITQAAIEALGKSDAVVGYKPYFQYVERYLRPSQKLVDTGMRHETERAEQAFRLAEEGQTVSVISSGDAGIYGMASLILEMKTKRGGGVDVEVVPGISAFQKAASLLGAPIGHDFCVISLSDLMTPWRLIERRIKAAAEADFVTAVYNPRSETRYWQLDRLKELFLLSRSPSTVVGYVRQAGRKEEKAVITTLADLRTEDVDMFTVVVIGNNQSYQWQGSFVTPRGYYREEALLEGGIGQSIMRRSFNSIISELRQPDLPPWRLWPLLHAVHTTADFDMETLLWTTERAAERLYEGVKKGEIKTIVTDVSMVASGIRKGALQRLGVEVVCLINDPRAAEMANQLGITRAQAGIRLAAKAHPSALFAIGNAPTALLELCDLVRKGQCNPSGIVAAPVGFVHVEESKHAAKTLWGIPMLLIEGRKGGSGIAATLVNSILTYDDAPTLRAGRDV
ncbi:MAG: precorrin-3B C(17)-methyltransferase [Prevotellaceae bacterium]|nr:precorrin-3B C(17)-methyltransferase [Prevotellaceae bacterium]